MHACIHARPCMYVCMRPGWGRVSSYRAYSVLHTWIKHGSTDSHPRIHPQVLTASCILHVTLFLFIGLFLSAYYSQPCGYARGLGTGTYLGRTRLRSGRMG